MLGSKLQSQACRLDSCMKQQCALIALVHAGAAATDVHTIVDMSTNHQGGAYFSELAAVEREETGHSSQALFFTDTKSNCIRQWTTSGICILF